jgi:hypothetical protein
VRGGRHLLEDGNRSSFQHLEFWMMDEVQNPVILSVIHHPQTPSDIMMDYVKKIQ